MKTIFLISTLLLSLVANAQYTRVDNSITMQDIFLNDTLRSVTMIISNQKVNFVFDNISIDSNNDIMIAFIHGDREVGVLLEMDYVELTSMNRSSVMTPNVIVIDKNPNKVKDGDIVLVYFYDRDKSHIVFKISGKHYKECIDIIMDNAIDIQKRY